MTFEEFLGAVKAETNLVEWYLGPPSKAEHVTEVYRGRWQIDEHGGTPVGHVLGEPLLPEELDAFRRKFPTVELPKDLVELLQRWNGVHLWADFESRRVYEGLAPLREWDLARRAMWAATAKPELLPDWYLALSYHTDSSSFVVLDAKSGRYFLMDSCGAMSPAPSERPRRIFWAGCGVIV